MSATEERFDFDSLALTIEFDDLLSRGADEELASRARQIQSLLTEIVSDFAKRETHIAKTYLPASREAEMGTLRAESGARVDQATGQIRRELAELESDLALQLVPEPPANTVAEIALLVERRGLLRNMDNLLRKSVLLEAVSRGDKLTLDSFRTAPFFDKLIPADELQQAVDAFGRLGKRDVAARLGQVRIIRAAVENAVASATRRVGPISSDGVTFVQ